MSTLPLKPDLFSRFLNRTNLTFNILAEASKSPYLALGFFVIYLTKRSDLGMMY